jgi:hypothetical protein
LAPPPAVFATVLSAEKPASLANLRRGNFPNISFPEDITSAGPGNVDKHSSYTGPAINGKVALTRQAMGPPHFAMQMAQVEHRRACGTFQYEDLFPLDILNVRGLDRIFLNARLFHHGRTDKIAGDPRHARAAA